MNDRDNGPAYWWARLARHRCSSRSGESSTSRARIAEWNRNGKKAMKMSRKEVQMLSYSLRSMIFNGQQLFKYQKPETQKALEIFAEKYGKAICISPTKGICFKRRWFRWWVPKIWQLICQQVHLVFVACFFYFFFFFFMVFVWSKRIAHFRFGVKMKITTLSLAAANLMKDKYASLLPKSFVLCCHNQSKF